MTDKEVLARSIKIVAMQNAIGLIGSEILAGETQESLVEKYCSKDIKWLVDELRQHMNRVLIKDFEQD